MGIVKNRLRRTIIRFTKPTRKVKSHRGPSGVRGGGKKTGK